MKINILFIILLLLTVSVCLQSPSLQEVLQKKTCQHSEFQGLSLQINAQLKSQFNTGDLQALNNVDLSNLQYRLVYNQEMILSLQKAIDERGQIMVLNGGFQSFIDIFAQKYWNQQLNFQECQSFYEKMSESQFQSGLIIQISDSLGWKEYLIKNKFTFIENGKFKFNVPSNSIIDLKMEGVKIFQKMYNTATGGSLQVNGQFDSQTEQALLASRAHGFVNQNYLIPHLYAQVSEEITPSTIKQYAGRVPNWTASHQVNNFRQIGDVEATISSYDTSLYEKNTLEKPYFCNCKEVGECCDGVELGCILKSCTKKQVCETCQTKFFVDALHEFTLSRRLTDLVPHYKVKFEYKGILQDKFGDELEDSLQIKLDGKIMKTFKIQDADSSKKVSGEFEIAHTSSKLNIEILCNTNLSPPQKGCATYFAKYTIYKCQNGCLSCNDYNSGCTSCNSGFQRIGHTVNGQCICRSKYTDDGINPTCFQRDECDQSYEGPFQHDELQGCLGNCEHHQTAMQAMKACDQDIRCKGITYVNNTIARKWGYQMRTSDILIGVSIDDSQKDTQSWLKHKNAQCCSSTCLTCSKANDPNACTSCSSPSYLSGTSCEKHCPQGYYKNDANQTCSKCFESCSLCSGPSKSECFECKSNYFKLENTNSSQLYQCLEVCPNGYAHVVGKKDEGNYCTKCDKKCQICSDLTNLNCSVCAQDHYLHLGHECHENCPQGFFNKRKQLSSQAEQLVCEQCHASCLSCQKGNTETDCLSCKDGKFLDLDSSLCVDKCTKYSYELEGIKYCNSQCPEGLNANNSEKTCVKGCPCPFKVKVETNECILCESQNLLNEEQKCVSSCSDGYYREASHCLKCNESCLTCNGPESNQCLSCVPPLQIFQNQCKLLCKERQYYDQTSKQCKWCFSSCEVCQDRTHKCLKCDAKYPYFIKQTDGSLKCYSVCPEGYKRDLKTDSWQKNSIECIKCDSAVDPQCSQAKPVNQCTLGYQMVQGKCQQCADSNCLECSSNVNDCVKCLQGYYQQSSQCFMCHPTCKTCKGPGKLNCITCSEFQAYDESKKEFFSTKFAPKENQTCEEIINENKIKQENQSGEYNKSYSNVYSLKDFENMKFSSSQVCTYEEVIKHLTPRIQQQAKLCSDKHTEFQHSSVITSSNQIVAQELSIFSSIFAHSSVYSNTEANKIVDIQDVNENFISLKSIPTVAQRHVIKSPFKCNQLSCSYSLETPVYFAFGSESQAVIIQRQNSIITLISQSTQKPISNQECRRYVPDVRENEISQFKYLLAQSSQNQKTHFILTLCGQRKPITNSQLQNNYFANEKVLIKSYNPSTNTLSVFSPQNGKSFELKMEGETNNPNELYQSYNVRQIEQVSVFKENLAPSQSISLLIQQTPLNIEEMNIKCLKHKNIQTLMIPVSETDSIKKSIRQNYSVEVVLNPCANQDIDSQIKLLTDNFNALQLSKLWVKIEQNGKQQNCQWNGSKKSINQEFLSSYVQKLQSLDFKVGIISSKHEWDTVINLNSLEQLSHEGKIDLVYVNSDESFNYDDWSSQINSIQFGNVSSPFGKQFIESYYNICGLKNVGVVVVNNSNSNQ